MKKLLLTFLLFLSAHAILAQAGQQVLQQNVSLAVKDIPVEDVLRELEKQLNGVVFAYSSGTFDVKRRISLSAEEEPLEGVLKRIFANQSLECMETGGRIVLKRKKQQRKTTGSQRTTYSSQRRANQQNSQISETQVVRTNEPVQVAQKRQSAKKTQWEEVEPDAYATPSSFSPIGDSVVQTNLVASYEASNLTRSPSTPAQLLNVRPNPKSLSHFSSFYGSPLRSDSKPLWVPDSSVIVRQPEARIRKKKLPKEREENDNKFRIYGSSTTGFTRLAERGGIQMGGSVVWLKNKRFGIGLAGYALQTGAQADDQLSGSDYRFAGGYGGVLMEYTFQPSELFHFSVPLLVAGGGMTYVQQIDRNINLGNRIMEDAQAMFVIEPGFAVEMNVIKYLRVALALNYRYATGTPLQYEASGNEITNSGGLSGLSTGITVKFGWF